MHFRTYVKPESRGQAGRWQSEYRDTMIDHDRVVGGLLDLVGELGITDDTIQTFGQFPPRPNPASFSLDEVLVKIRTGIPSA
jgi:hypothetical protein